VAGVYEKAVDRESAFEALKGRTQSRQTVAATSAGTAASASHAPTNQAPEPAAAPERGLLDGLGDLMGGGTRRTRASVGEQLIKSAASAVGREVGRQIIRGVLGGIFGSGRR
jgi:hypothetical protein